MVKPTVTVTLTDALRWGFKRALETGRTQQFELSPNLYARVTADEGVGRKFLLFQLEGEPDEQLGKDLAAALKFKDYTLSWFAGQSVRSLVVDELI